MGQKETEPISAGMNRIMIYGPKTDGTSLNSRWPRARRWRSVCRLERPAC
jgi:hypothetical protein